jgi:hypothetical protein
MPATSARSGRPERLVMGPAGGAWLGLCRRLGRRSPDTVELIPHEPKDRNHVRCLLRQ